MRPGVRSTRGPVTATPVVATEGFTPDVFKVAFLGPFGGLVQFDTGQMIDTGQCFDVAAAGNEGVTLRDGIYQVSLWMTSLQSGRVRFVGDNLGQSGNIDGLAAGGPSDAGGQARGATDIFALSVGDTWNVLLVGSFTSVHGALSIIRLASP